MAVDRIRPLARPELDRVVEWAAEEGWNPGLADAEAFWAADADGFLGLERDGELIGSGSVVSYDGRFGFMGLFIVRPDLRGRGIGRRLWLHRRDHLLDRLRPGAGIGMDGVVAMRSFYERGGFAAAHDQVRMRTVGRAAAPDPDLEPLAATPRSAVEELDRAHFGVPRERFLRAWTDPPGGHALALPDGGRLRGFGVARPCREGFKIGPLVADGAEVAERIFSGLSAAAEGSPVWIDVPERNAAAVALAERHGMEETFRCTRMYLGEPPPVNWDGVFGVTTLELG